MALANFLTMDVEVWRRAAGTENEYGEKTDTWTKVATIKGVIQPSTGNTVRVENGISVTNSHTLFTLAGANIRAGDKTKYGDNWYNVVYVGDAAGRAHHNEVELNLVS